MSKVLVTLGSWMFVLDRKRVVVLRALGSKLEKWLCWCFIGAMVVIQ